MNKRLIYQALNDRRITDSSFRQQIIYTVNQVETIYWGLVQAYEDVQAKERALDQSNQLLTDNKKQLQIGTMAPLDVVNAGIDRSHGSAGANQRAKCTPNTRNRSSNRRLRAQSERSGTFRRTGDSHRPGDTGGASGGEPAGGGAGPGGVPAEA